MTEPITYDRVVALLEGVRPGTEPPRTGCVEGAIGNATIAASYHVDGSEPDAIHVASYLLRSLARDHCFMDGNKRVAWLACLEVLAVLGDVTIEADQEEAAKMVDTVASGAASVREIAEWIAHRLVPFRRDEP